MTKNNANALGLAFTDAHRDAIDADVERRAGGMAVTELAPNEIDYDWRADTNSYPFDTQVSRWHYNPHFPDLDKTHLKIAKWLESKRPFVRFENGMICFKGSTVAYAAWHLDDLWSKGIIDDLNRVTLQGLVWIMFAEQQ